MTRSFRHLQLLKRLVLEGELPIGGPAFSFASAHAMARKGHIKISVCGIAKTAAITELGRNYLEECHKPSGQPERFVARAEGRSNG